MALAIASVSRVAATGMALLHINAIVVQSCCSLLVILGHRLQPPRGCVMREFAGDTATSLSMVEQGALLDAHPAITLGRLNGPCAGGWNSAMALSRRVGNCSNIFKRARNMVLERSLANHC